MSQIPFSLQFVHGGSSRQRNAPLPSSSAQRHFDGCLQQPMVEGCMEAAENFGEDRDAQRQRRQQLILQALQHPGDCYRDKQRLIHRGQGVCLSWRLLNGPLAGLFIKAELIRDQLHIMLSVCEWSHYLRLRLLSQQSFWLQELSQCGFSISLKVCHGVPSAE